MTQQVMVDGRRRRAEAKRESRRAHILATAERVFAEKGYHQAHISDIIRAAGIARGTFYLYFPSKNAIFHELLDQLLVELRATVVGVETGAGAPPLESQLLGTVTRIVRAVEGHRALTRIILREAVGLDREVDEKLSEFYGSLQDFVSSSLENGKHLGLVRDLDTDVVAGCILGSVKYLLEQMPRLGEDGTNVERIGLAVLDYNLHGVLP